MEEEKELFIYKNFLEKKFISLEELCSYYRALRFYENDINKPLESSSFKKRIYPLTKLILKIDRITTGRKLIVFDDKRADKIGCGRVYAASHVGRYDIESILEAIDEQVYFVMGDAEETYRNFEGFFLDKMSGRIAFDTGYQVQEIRRRLKNGDSVSKEELALYYSYKNDRHIAELNCTKRVAMGDSIFINPEGAWNITDRITQPIYDGAARIAISGKGVINPIGVIRDRKTYKVNIGSEMDVTGAQISDVKDVSKQLFENINSLVGEMIFYESENKPPELKRGELGNASDLLDAHIADIMSEEANGYTRDIIEATRCEDPDRPENVMGYYPSWLPKAYRLQRK